MQVVENMFTDLSMKEIFTKIFQQDCLLKSPPVLIDVGASGSVHEKFKPIARYSICIAFDADNREMHQVNEEDSKDYKKLFVVNSVLSEKEDSKLPFYLTKYPFCSSTLEPDTENLKNWDRADIFQIDKLSSIKSTNLKKVLRDLNLVKIDWFKTDSQGTDLRLFRSLGEEMIKKVIVSEFEPGMIDSYIGEDKFQDVLAFMSKFNFWISDIKIRGFRRIKPSHKDNIFNNLEKAFFSKCLKQSPGWGEITYINTLEEVALFSEREFFLSWVFATILEQHGYAFEVARQGNEKFENNLFNEMNQFSIKKMKIPFYLTPFYLLKKKLSARY